MIKFDVLNRFSGDVQFTAEIDCSEGQSKSFKLGLAVRWALKNRGSLSDANLSGANLSGADLRGAHLSQVDLQGVDLWDAHIEGVFLEEEDVAEGAALRLRVAIVTKIDLKTCCTSAMNCHMLHFTL